MVLTDRLSKYVQLEAMTSMTAEACAERFKECWWRFRGFPEYIISDRGSDWVGQFWATLCRIVGIEQRLSTAYHPQSDGGTERANQEVQAILRTFIAFDQFDWPDHLAACQLALNGRDSSVTGMSPNSLLLGYEVNAVQRVEAPTPSATTGKGRAVAFAQRLREGTELAQAAIAFAQQRLEEESNSHRRPAERFQVGDKVWLSLRYIKSPRPSKKLDWVTAKYTVVAVPTPLTVTLDVPRGTHPTFHVDLVERAATDPLPSQALTNTEPGPLLVEDEDGVPQEEYIVEEILAAKNARGQGKRRNVLVKWAGHDQPTWEPLENLQETKVLADYEQK
ncbi:hypothetical protein DCS_05895 [Drechmeria coniospora]|uniref:Uncharacterized protein n=1 Tax=Drechmeria coniospora TaxID=98403 RepID=A0A151GA42_DRECN|nr:hypothetical protein DCS_05895 [Drechmeria coniospora]KYK53946.1 hypothetical protein DCS_05895 [Drechmeria coniospora]